MTTAEERTKIAIGITRGVLKKAMNSPFTMGAMTDCETNPEHVQGKVYEILCYLEKTKPDWLKKDSGIDTIKEALQEQADNRRREEDFGIDTIEETD